MGETLNMTFDELQLLRPGQMITERVHGLGTIYWGIVDTDRFDGRCTWIDLKMIHVDPIGDRQHERFEVGHPGMISKTSVLGLSDLEVVY